MSVSFIVSVHPRHRAMHHARHGGGVQGVGGTVAGDRVALQEREEHVPTPRGVSPFTQTPTPL